MNETLAERITKLESKMDLNTLTTNETKELVKEIYDTICGIPGAKGLKERVVSVEEKLRFKSSKPNLIMLPIGAAFWTGAVEVIRAVFSHVK